MAIYVKDKSVDRLARELAELEGKTITEVIAEALTDKHEKLMSERMDRRRKIEELRAALRALPVLDPTPSDELLYDEYGVPR